MSFHVPEKYRAEHPLFGMGEGNNGLFILKGRGHDITCIASDGFGWEHVSVSIVGPKGRWIIPSWEIMCSVKRVFWDDEDCVVQFHPPASQYVNNADVLHLWRKIGSEFETPPSILVGLK